MRFDGVSKSVAPLLIGAMFGKFRSEFPKHVQLPSAMVPEVVRNLQPDMKYQTLFRLESPKGRMIGVGDHAITVSMLRPYSGWAEFKPLILDVFGRAKETELLGKVSRLSIKYVNVLEGSDNEVLPEVLKLRLELGDDNVTSGPIQLRRHIEVDGATVITQVTSPGAIRLEAKPPVEIRGTIVEVDVIRPAEKADLSEALEQHLEQLHSIEKRMFFGLLTESTEKRYEPRF